MGGGRGLRERETHRHTQADRPRERLRGRERWRRSERATCAYRRAGLFAGAGCGSESDIKMDRTPVADLHLHVRIGHQDGRTRVADLHLHARSTVCVSFSTYRMFVDVVYFFNQEIHGRKKKKKKKKKKISFALIP